MGGNSGDGNGGFALVPLESKGPAKQPGHEPGSQTRESSPNSPFWHLPFPHT